MFALRTVTFRLQQSPKWLSSAGRIDEAVVALRKISHINGDPVAWTPQDVVDQSEAALLPGSCSPRQLSTSPGRVSGGDYQGLEGAPRVSVTEDDWGIAAAQAGSRGDDDEPPPPISPRSPPSPEMLESGFNVGDAGFARTEGRRQRIERGGEPTWVDRLPPSAGESVDGYMARLDELFSPQ